MVMYFGMCPWAAPLPLLTVFKIFHLQLSRRVAFLQEDASTPVKNKKKKVFLIHKQFEIGDQNIMLEIFDWSIFLPSTKF